MEVLGGMKNERKEMESRKNKREIRKKKKKRCGL